MSDKKVSNYRCLQPLLICLLTCLLSMPLPGQDLKQDMEKMVQNYTRQENLSIKTQVRFYNSAVAGARPTMSITSSVKKRGTAYLYETSDSDILINEQFLLMVHRKDKKIVYKPHTKEQYSASLRNMTTANIDSILTLNDSIRYLGIKNGGRTYSIFNARASIRHADITFDSSDARLRYIVYHYAKGKEAAAKAEIEFIYEEAATGKEDSFLESHYVERKNKILVPAPAFKAYKVMEVNE
jgi:hypothetical protein